MKRRNFLGLAGLAAAPFAFLKRTAGPTKRILVRPSTEGRVLPQVESDRKMKPGTLCPGNAQMIAANIEKMFAGKKIAIARGCYGTRLETDAELVAGWVDRSPALVKATIKNGITSISFSAGHCFYVFTSQAKTAWERNDFKHAYFCFSWDELTVIERTYCGELSAAVFRIQQKA